jgi:hypothetical protein
LKKVAELALGVQERFFNCSRLSGGEKKLCKSKRKRPDLAFTFFQHPRPVGQEFLWNFCRRYIQQVHNYTQKDSFSPFFWKDYGGKTAWNRAKDFSLFGRDLR